MIVKGRTAAPVKTILIPAGFLLRSASSMVVAPHCGDNSLSDDLSADEISATGGRHRFALFRQRCSDKLFLHTPTLFRETAPARSAVFLMPKMKKAGPKTG